MIREGGNTFQEAEPIRGDLAQLAVGDIINNLKNRFGQDISVAPQGSCVRTRPNSYCGDIDILLQIKNADSNADYESEISEIEEFIKKTWSESVSVIQQGALKNIISFTYPYNEDGQEKVAQVDIKLTHNFSWTKNFGTSLKKSGFKDALRKIIIKICASVVPYQGEDPDSHQNEFFTVDDFRGKNGEDGQWAGEQKTQNRYIMDDEGLFFGRRQREGKKSPGFRTFKKYNRQVPRWGAYDTKEFVTNKFASALKIIFGPEVRRSDVRSVENLIRFLHSGRYAYASQENLNRIKEQVEFELERGGRGMGDDYMERFDQLWDEYSGNNFSQLKECNNFSLKFRDMMRRMSVL